MGELEAFSYELPTMHFARRPGELDEVESIKPSLVRRQLLHA